MGHTPGPWSVLLDKPSKRRMASQVPRMALVVTGGHGDGRQAIDCTRSGKDYAEDSANARLIAAAPELLSALEELAELMDAVLHDDYRPDRFTLQPAISAIRKAKGE